MMASASTNGHQNGQQNGQRAGQSAAWLQLSVQQFFEQCNWDGRAIAPAAAPLSDGAAAPDTSLNLTLSVRQFFDEFPWEGKPAIAAPVLFDALEADDTAESDITLDDITNLFG